MESQDANIMKAKATLKSKDFQLVLKWHIMACLLSPNLTAYVEDTLQHLLDFIQEHQDLFKVDKLYFEETDLHEQFMKLVSKTLANCHGHMKIMLIKSIGKQSSIINIAQSLSMGNMDMNTAHWMCCLCLFLIGTQDFKEITLQDTWALSLVPMIHSDLARIVEEGLDNVNVEELSVKMLINRTWSAKVLALSWQSLVIMQMPRSMTWSWEMAFPFLSITKKKKIPISLVWVLRQMMTLLALASTTAMLPTSLQMVTGPASVQRPHCGLQDNFGTMLTIVLKICGRL
ncbi:hypothetical protein BKA82DRAFT_135947 [Pisolithus tinctorius]|uniref:Uncharacterized protein n=1 Tax=Pisolithus tinctorius Marx 270 TaxID=870435 RepID=A0A0C3PHT0_PISTI|nr:hypothetical protein BKA82DRAFT_135947 [Pisolithus tinctorius]KIO07594.1 hypothetical protein M404DRAFT_135947 [Pisolithus tinctorius Marx 270]